VYQPRRHFGPIPHVRHGRPIDTAHAIVLDAYRRAHGLPPWLKREHGEGVYPSEHVVNLAVDWWNDWQNMPIQPG
jgi:hypothetical protein